MNNMKIFGEIVFLIVLQNQYFTAAKYNKVNYVLMRVREIPLKKDYEMNINRF